MMNQTTRTSVLLAGLALLFSAACDRKPPADSTPTSSANRFETDDTAQKQESASQPLSRDQQMDAAMTLIQSGKPDEAIETLTKMLIADPGDVEVIFRIALLKADKGKYADAIELLEGIPADHPEAGLPAIGQAADWCMVIEDYDGAERKYQQVLELAKGVPNAHRQLAYLYNRQGRRHEAAIHLRELCRLGNIQQDELHAMMVLGHAMLDDPNQPATGPRPYFPIGPAATARMLYTASRYVEAVDALEASVRSGKEAPSIVAFYGLLAIEAQDVSKFRWWLSQVDDSVKDYAEYWAAIGAFLVSENRFEEAARALGEALVRDPTNTAAMRRMHQSLTALGKTDQAELWMDRHSTLRDVTLASNAIGQTQTPDAKDYETVINGLEKLQRPLEAMTWRMFAAFQRNASKEQVADLNRRRSELFRSDDAFPSQADRLCGIDLSQFPMPSLDVPDTGQTPSMQATPSTGSLAAPKLTNIAELIGLNHTYAVASQPVPERFALYQSLGGGVAVLDYDLDGSPDLHLAQGDGEPPAMVGQRSNLLYRNLSGQLDDVTDRAGVTDFRYTVGLTSGDWNQDGFPDLVIANIGNKVLLLNNGDGTFQSRVFDEDPENEVLTSSVAMADLTGDAIPDIYSLHYVKDPAMRDRPPVNERGEIETVSPSSFQPGLDSMAINDGLGGMQHQLVSTLDTDASTGLGVVIANWDEDPGNEIFVGNDIRANQLWKRSTEGEWVDMAPILGCALGVGGVETASMGIAVADFDGNGLRDIHITNFYQEPVSLFMNRGGMFQDRCIQYRLNRDSSNVLGFGCQAIDYNLDGRPDLAITNGNIEKAPGEPLQQPPQLFTNLGDKFELAEVDDTAGYWQGKYLGRSMARLDFNRDGKQDLVITHLDSPTALMLNETAIDHRWLSVRVVGVESERDAIGTQIDLFAGDRKWTHWIVGGDGYLCHNEPVIDFGLGTISQIDRLVVTWPSGKQQTLSGIEANQRLLIIENEPTGFALQ